MGASGAIASVEKNNNKSSRNHHQSSSYNNNNNVNKVEAGGGRMDKSSRISGFGGRWRKFMFGGNKHQQDYVSVMRPCFELLRIHGLFPYKIISGGGGRGMNKSSSRMIRSSKLGLAYSTLATSITVGLASLALYQMDVSHRLSYNSVPAYLQGNCYIFLGCSIAASSYLNSRKRMKLLSSLADISSRLLLSSSTISSLFAGGGGRITAGAINAKDVLGFVFLLGQTPNVYSEDWSLFCVKALSLYITLVVYLMDSLYVDSVLVIEAYFRRINNHLLSLKNSIASEEPHLLRRIYHEHNNPVILLEIRSIEREHNEVSELVQRLNETFSLQIVATVTLTFAEITFSLYFYILTFTAGDGRTSIELKTQFWYCYYITSVTYYALKMISIVYACEIARAQATRTGIIVHQVLIDTTDRHLKEELQLFSLQLLHRDNTFQAKGLCLDATLITSIVGGITTYLLILIQFLVSGNDNNNNAAGGCGPASSSADNRTSTPAAAIMTSLPPLPATTIATTIIAS